MDYKENLSMALDEGDKAIIRNIAFEAAEHTAQKVTTLFEAKLQLHQAECPFAEEFSATKNQAKGGWWTITALVGALTGVAALVLSWWKK